MDSDTGINGIFIMKGGIFQIEEVGIPEILT